MCVCVCVCMCVCIFISTKPTQLRGTRTHKRSPQNQTHERKRLPIETPGGKVRAPNLDTTTNAATHMHARSSTHTQPLVYP